MSNGVDVVRYCNKLVTQTSMAFACSSVICSRNIYYHLISGTHSCIIQMPNAIFLFANMPHHQQSEMGPNFFITSFCPSVFLCFRVISQTPSQRSPLIRRSDQSTRTDLSQRILANSNSETYTYIRKCSSTSVVRESS